MAWNYAHPNKPLNVEGIISRATQQGWYFPADPAKVYTSPAHMGAMGTYYAAHNNEPAPEVGQMGNSPQALLFLYSQIVLGHPVIVDVTTDIGNTHSAAHFVVVTGVSLMDTQISYNDPYGYISPGHHQAAQELANWLAFWNSWSANGDDQGRGDGWYMIVK